MLHLCSVIFVNNILRTNFSLSTGKLTGVKATTSPMIINATSAAAFIFSNIRKTLTHQDKTCIWVVARGIYMNRIRDSHMDCMPGMLRAGLSLVLCMERNITKGNAQCCIWDTYLSIVVSCWNVYKYVPNHASNCVPPNVEIQFQWIKMQREGGLNFLIIGHRILWYAPLWFLGLRQMKDVYLNCCLAFGFTMWTHSFALHDANIPSKTWRLALDVSSRGGITMMYAPTTKIVVFR